MIAGLALARDLEVRKIEIQSDSQLIVNQLQGSYQARDAQMMAYLEKVKELQSTFEDFTITQVPRAENSHADALATLGANMQGDKPLSIPVILLQWPAIWKEEKKDVTSISPGNTWITPLYNYLKDGILPLDRNEARKIQRQSARFTLYED